MDTVQLSSSSPCDENHSTSSEPVTDTEDQEISDDDDRNHKHRKREAQPHSFDNDVQEQPIRRQNKKRKPFEHRQMFLDNENTNLERETMQKRRPVLTTPRLPSDFGPRARINQAFRNDPGLRFDMSASAGRGFLGRGRGRSTGAWSQQDSRFGPLETVDFASQIASQGPPTHPSLFVGTSVPTAGSAQNASWGAYGFIPGMTGRILDPLHQLGLQGALQPAMSPLLNMGMPRQRCRDFEERGFCLRGDMCPMEHGVNRIVVEDVQSLSQFNLPVSIPTSHALGIQAGLGSLPSINTSSTLMTSSKSIPMKDAKAGPADETLEVEGVSSVPGVAEADVYDPDQPLWNNESAETSSVHLRLPSSNNDDERFWTADSSAQKRLKLSDDVEIEQTNKDFSDSVSSQTTTTSVWGRVGRGSKSEMRRKVNSTKAATPHLENEMSEDLDGVKANVAGFAEGKHDANADMGQKTIGVQPLSRPDSERNGGKTSQKASRTLYIHGIPQKSNRVEALLSHFQKFGKVIDIYIPLNSEIAFVQFSRREEAEAALKAPDAVMGNRFIKLWWANRDRVSGDGKSGYPTKLMQHSGTAVPSILSQAPSTDREPGIIPLATESRIPAAEKVLTIMPPVKSLSANGPKVTSPVQKKLEGLELLEELRRKQEILAQKRDEFRRRLDKFEKQTISVKKVELSSEQINKGHKVDTGNESSKSITPKQTNVSTTGTNQEEEEVPKIISGESLASPTHGSSLKQTNHVALSLPSTLMLDNRPVTFRVLPPLPDGFADVSELKDHFSSYGDLASVVLEDPQQANDKDGLTPPQSCSACISFTTRASAERAYLNGRCWQGQNLQFMWLTVSQNSKSGCSTEEVSESPRSSSVEIQVEPVTSGSSLLSAAEPTNHVNNGAPDITNVESVILEQITSTASSNVPKSLSKVSCSSPNMSSCEERPPISDVPS